MSDIVERLNDIWRDDDHERGCAGRNYECTCGFDARSFEAAKDAADLISALRAKLAEARAEALEEAARCIEEGFDRGIASKADRCAHDKFQWEDCDYCAAAAIRALKSGGANG